MFKSTEEFDSAIRNILVQIRDGQSVESIKHNLPADDFEAALIESIDRRFLQGVSYVATLGGMDFATGNVRVTYTGLQFIEEG